MARDLTTRAIAQAGPSAVSTTVSRRGDVFCGFAPAASQVIGRLRVGCSVGPDTPIRITGFVINQVASLDQTPQFLRKRNFLRRRGYDGRQCRIGAGVADIR